MWYLIKAGNVLPSINKGSFFSLETRTETHVFLKSETKTDRKPAVKITLQYKLSSAFCEKWKIACKKFEQLKREIFRFAIFWRKAHRFWSKEAQVTAVWNEGFLWQNEAFLHNFSEHLLENPARYIYNEICIRIAISPDKYKPTVL